MLTCTILWSTVKVYFINASDLHLFKKVNFPLQSV